jgi:hypothetical protein
MDDGAAARCVAMGLLAIVLGLLLLVLFEDPILTTFWGVALILIGGVLSVLGLGVLLRLWR